ncbi:hypothetical protein FQA39_LY05969 [Lamprigera yunnana]|nr:hypothetical protein FQA39_LY05969 [Lamprigera yunnana]
MVEPRAPTITTVREELKDALAEIFFTTCPSNLKTLMCLEPYLEGAGDELWKSPSDLLIGRVCLKPPLTKTCMKALTHQGILSIGYDIEQRVEAQFERAKKRALDEERAALLAAAELLKREAVEEAIALEKSKCDKEKEQMVEEFTLQLEMELRELEVKLRKEFEKVLRRQKRDLDEMWLDKVKAAVEETISTLTADFLKELSEQQERLYKMFQLELKKEKVKHQFDLQEVRKSCQESFTQLKHQLQCKNVASIMYVLCAEREKCRVERMNVEKCYRAQIESLKNTLNDKDAKIADLKWNSGAKVDEMQSLRSREEFLKEVLIQFQKFINFALRSCPTQAEFLLDTEKLLLFQLTENIDKIRTKRGKKLCGGKTSTKPPPPSIISERSLDIKNYHQCDNELWPPGDRVTSCDYLPAFHYNKNMYVREEFRNMMSQGIKVSPSNIIYCKDVENLMPILRTTTRERLETPKSKPKEGECKIIATVGTQTENEDSEKDNMRCKHLSSEDLLYPSFPRPSNELIADTTINLQKVVETQQRKSDETMFELINPCCARCTQTYIKPPTLDNEAEEGSVKKYRTQSVKYQMRLGCREKDDGIRLSKLSLARDSLLIHKHSLQVKKNGIVPADSKHKVVTSTVFNTNLVEQKTYKPKSMKLLSDSRDSLELLRLHSKLSKQKVESKESVEIKNGMGTHYEEGSGIRSVNISRITMDPMGRKQKKKLKKHPTTICSVTEKDSLPSTEAGQSEEVVVEKPKNKRNVCRIVGNKKLKVHLEKQKHFTLHRAASLLGIFNKHPSLMKFFTSCC